jgi:hypothetical protein
MRVPGMRLCLRRRPEQPEEHHEELVKLVRERVNIDAAGEQQLSGPQRACGVRKKGSKPTSPIIMASCIGTPAPRLRAN